MKTCVLYVVFIVSLAIPNLLNGQAPVAKELQNLFQAYQGKQNLSFEAKYKYFPDLISKKATDSLTSKTVLAGESYYFKIGDYEFMGDGNYSLFADYENKQIVLGELNENETKKRRLGFIQNILESSGSEISSFSPGNNLKGLKFEYKNQQIAKVEIVYDPTTYFISKCTIHYLEDTDAKTGRPMFSRLEITYFNFESSGNQVPASYRLNKVLSYDKKNVFIVQSYKNFEFVNLTHLKNS